jgi:hypothetical protein
VSKFTFMAGDYASKRYSACMRAASAVATQQQTASDEGEDPYNYGSGHTRPQSGAVDALSRRNSRKVMHRVPEVQGGEQDSNSA